MTAVFLTLTSFSLFAEFPKINLSVEPEFSIKNGKLGEYVLLKNSSMSKASDTGKYPDNTLSYLEWQIKNELMAGLKAHADYRNLFADAELKFGFPQKSGIVMDSDWLNIQRYVTAEEQTLKTNYSEHKNKIDYDFSVSIQAGYKYDILNWISVSPFLGTDFSKISFSAKDGWYQYSYSTDHWTTGTKQTIKGKILEYSREETNLWIGATINFILPFDIILGCSAKTAAILYTFNTDNHIGKNVTFTDICWGFFDSYNLNFNCQIPIHKGISATYNFDYYNLNTIKGKSYEKSSGASYWTENKAQNGGASARIWTSSFGIKVNLL